MTWILIGAIVTIIGGLITAFGTYLHNKNSSEKTTRIEQGVSNANLSVDELKKQNINLISKSEKQSQTIDNLRQENTQLYTTLANETLKIQDNLTGGNSYCEAVIGNISKENDKGMFLFYVEGKVPLQDITAFITNLNDPDANTITQQTVIERTLELGKISPKDAAMTTNFIELDKVRGVNYNIQFNANNGPTMQLLRMRYIKDKWVKATKIVTFDERNKILYLEIDKDYPVQDKVRAFQ